MKTTDLAQIDTIIKLYNEGKSYVAIGAALGVSSRTIQEKISRLRLEGLITDRYDKVVKPTVDRIDFSDIEDNNFEELIKEAKISWKVPKSIIKPIKKEFKSYLIVADTHVPSQNILVVKSVLSLCEDVPFDGFIINGDFMDLACISHWNKNKRKTLEMKRLKSDYIQGNILLDEFDKRLPKDCDKRFLYGNHERFIEDLVEEMPELEGLFEPVECLKLKERGYQTFTKQNHVEKLGRLYVAHGWFTGVSPVNSALNAFNTNVLISHVHTEEYKLQSSVTKELALVGASTGCLCDLNPSYMQNKAHRWSHGFAIVHVYPSGFFDLDLKRIVNSRFIYNSKVYDGARI